MFLLQKGHEIINAKAQEDENQGLAEFGGVNLLLVGKSEERNIGFEDGRGSN